MFLDVPILWLRKLCRATAVETHICFDFQGGKFKSYLIPGSSVFTVGLRKLAYSISDVYCPLLHNNTKPKQKVGLELIPTSHHQIATTFPHQKLIKNQKMQILWAKVGNLQK